MNVGYEVGSSVTVRALHQMPMPGPEGELHAHDYRFDVVVARSQLDEHGMVCDLDVLRAAMQAMAARIRDQDLEAIRPAEAEADYLRAIENQRDAGRDSGDEEQPQLDLNLAT